MTAADFRITGVTVHVEGCLWAGGLRARTWMGSGGSTRKRIADAARRQGYILCCDCRPLDTLPSEQGASQ